MHTDSLLIPALLVATLVGCGDVPTTGKTPPSEAATAAPAAKVAQPPATAAAAKPTPEPTVDSGVAPPTPAPEKPTGPVFDGPHPKALPCDTPPEGMVCIPGGPFIRGSNDGPEHSRPEAVIWVQTFYMDINEVTYAQYQECARTGRCDDARPLYRDFDAPQQPMNGASWFNALKYCKKHGKTLPTEAQWEKAARGTDGRLYPWGDEPATCERAIIKDESGRGCGRMKTGKRPEKGKPWPVGSKPPGPNGLYDMAGNSWEWVIDWYSDSYDACGESCRGVDPRGPCDGEVPCRGYRRKVVRGGSWYWEAEYATTVYRRPHVPSNDPFHHFGFRCAATTEMAAALRTP